MDETAVLVEQGSALAARILHAARDLLLKRGFSGVTVAEIAAEAGVGKGTVYLYWPTKADLFVGLFARDFIAVVDETLERIEQQPELVQPRLLCPLMLRIALAHPFVRAHHEADRDARRILSAHPGNRELFDRLAPAAVFLAVLPILREHGLVRTDAPVPEQSYAIGAVLAGFLTALTDPQPPVAVDDPFGVMEAAVHALLEPSEPATHQAVEAAAAATASLVRTARATVIATLSPAP